MGKLETLEDGRHRITGGFSTKDPDDMKMLHDKFNKDMVGQLEGKPKKAEKSVPKKKSKRSKK